ncbi:MAG: MFS transporter [Opitutales bacterium]|nr:MFS transporter [Opitutales bacterium]
MKDILIFRNNNYFRLWFALSVSSLGDTLLSLWSICLVYNYTKSSFFVSLVFLAGSIPDILFRLISGAFVDRYNPKKILCLSGLFQSVALLPLLLIPYTDKSFILWVVVIVNFLQSIFNTFFSSSVSVLVPGIVDKEDLSKANAMIGLTGSILGFLGYGVSGILLSFISPTTIVIIDIVSFLVVSVISYLITYNYNSENCRIDINLKTIFEGVSFIRKQPLLKFFIVWAVLGNLTMAPVMVFLPSIASRFSMNALEGSPLSLFYMAIAAGSFVASLFLSFCSVRNGRKILFVSGTVISISIIVLELSDIVIITLLSCFSISFSITYSAVVLVTVFQTVTPKNLLGRVGSTFDMIAKTSFPLGYFLVGLASTSVPVFYLFIISSLLMLSSTLFVFVFDKSINEVLNTKSANIG